MLRAELYAAIGIIVASKKQAIRTALLVVDVSEVGGIAAANGCGRDAGRTDGHRHRRGWFRAGETPAAIITARAIDRMRACAQGENEACRKKPKTCATPAIYFKRSSDAPGKRGSLLS
jgi:hypothetical protein